MKEKIQKIYRGEWDNFKSRTGRAAAVCALGFVAAALLYYVASRQDLVSARELYSSIGQAFAEKGLTAEMTNIDLFLMILANNITAGFFVFASGIIPLVFLPFLSVLFNGALLGVVAAVSQDAGVGIAEMAMSLLPHGIVELPALFFTAGLGIRICLVVTKKMIGRGKGSNFAAEMAGAARSFVLVALPLFLLAAFIEVFVTLSIVR